MKNVFLFGASKLGELAHSALKTKYNIVGFIDNDYQKQGDILCNVKIHNPKILENLLDVYVIISSMYDIEIVGQLFEMGIKKFGVFIINNGDYEIQNYDYTGFSNFQVDVKKVCLLVHNNSGSNTKAMLKYINNVNYSKYKIVYVLNYNKNNEYYYNILTSKLILTTHDIRCREDQITIQLWHGFPLKGLSYMSNYSGQNIEANHLAWSKIDYIISYSQTYSTLLNACYGVDGNKYKILGMPRNDLLFEKNSRAKLEKVLEQKMENRKIIFYMPTFRNTIYGEKNGEQSSFLNNLSYEDLNKLDSFFQQNNIHFIMKLHPEEEVTDIRLNNICVLKENDLINNDLDLYEVMGCSQILITDYSSVYFDFLLLDKPIIFFTPDFEVYEEDRGFLLEPYDFWAPGEKCQDIQSLKTTILSILSGKDDYSKNRKIVRDIVHRYKDNRSSERVWAFVDKILSAQNKIK